MPNNDKNIPLNIQNYRIYVKTINWTATKITIATTEFNWCYFSNVYLCIHINWLCDYFYDMYAMDFPMEMVQHERGAESTQITHNKQWKKNIHYPNYSYFHCCSWSYVQHFFFSLFLLRCVCCFKFVSFFSIYTFFAFVQIVFLSFSPFFARLFCIH